MKNSETFIKQANEILNENAPLVYDVFNFDEVDMDSVEDWSEIVEFIQDNSYLETEVIYFASAMEYLMENDTSLQESLGLASELGFEVSNLNSETLASLLKSQDIKDEFYSVEDELEELFNELNKEEEEDE